MKHTAIKLLATAAVAASAASAHAQNAYVVGITAAMTGPAAATYAPVIDALKAYIDHVNGLGGVNGKPIQLIIVLPPVALASILFGAHYDLSVLSIVLVLLAAFCGMVIEFLVQVIIGTTAFWITQATAVADANVSRDRALLSLQFVLARAARRHMA